MDLFQRAEKNIINYSSEDFISTTARDLIRITQEEAICRSYYRMTRELDR